MLLFLVHVCMRVRESGDAAFLGVERNSGASMWMESESSASARA